MKVVNDYLVNGKVDRVSLCKDIASREVCNNEMWNIVSDPRFQASYNSLEYTHKIPIKEWTDEYLHHLCTVDALDDTRFNPDFLSYLDSVASYLAYQKLEEHQSIPSKINEFLGKIIWGISDFIFG